MLLIGCLNATVLYPGVTHGPCLLLILAGVQVTDCAGVTGVVSRQGESVLSVSLRSLSRQLWGETGDSSDNK